MAALVGVYAAAGDTWTLMNPTGRDYKDELVRIKVDVPSGIDKKPYVVKEDGKDVPYQIEEIGGRKYIWVVTDLGKGQTHTYTIEPGKSSRVKPRVKVRKRWGSFTMDNGLLAVRVPAEAAERVGQVRPVGPVRQVRLPNGKWVGKSFWKTDRKLKRFTSELVGDGTVFGKIRLRYEFEGKGGLFGEAESFAQIDVSVEPGKRHIIIEEFHAMNRGEWWEFDCAAGWKARGAVVKPHFGGFGRPTMKDPDGNPYPWPPDTLKVGQTRMHDTLLNLIPRWSQAYDDGWLFMATDGRSGVGAIACRAGKWLWPYNNMIEIKVKESADYVGMRCPTWRGKRYWYLIVGPTETWKEDRARSEYVLRHACEGLDKLHQEYILDWPGLKPPEDKKLTPEQAAAWSSGAGRFSRRNKPFPGWGPGGAHWSGGDHPIKTLTRVQNMFDPDCYGNHWLFYSPENPNFFSHWVNKMFRGVEKLKSHPQFDAIRRLAIQKAREELYFGVTLPGGAGQECFGYMSRGSWQWRAKFCKEHLGVEIDSAKWPWRKAAGSYILRTSHPMPDGSRRSHPGGDTHPPGPDPFEAARWVDALVDVGTLRTEEFPGYGVVLRNHSGTPRETYFGFKSGPNRGHFHGDQLSFHYCAYGRPLAVDHHASYAPRPGQEHMHNRVAFHTDTMPWANMDGYERLIAFKTSERADVAVGQVESERLRARKEFPPEEWDRSLPQVELDPNLKYRRTVVLLKSVPGADTRHPPADVFVIRDQFAGPVLNATYCLHVLGDRCEREANRFRFGNLDLYVAAPAEFTVSRHDWQHEYGGLEATKGLRLTLAGRREGEFITVLVPRPPLRGEVLECVLRKAYMVKYKPKQGPVEEVEPDVKAYIPCRDGKPVEGPAYVVGSLERYEAFFFQEGRIAMGEDGIAQLRADGVTGRFGYRYVSVDYALRFRIEKDVVGGTWSGRWRDSGAAKGGQPGAESEEGVERRGELSGRWRKDVLLPVSVFDETWTGPRVEAFPPGVRVGGYEVLFGGALDDEDAVTYVSVKEGDSSLLSVTGEDIDLDRSQGDIGLFVPDAGYPFGVIPDWLIRQRGKIPDWYEESWPPTRAMETHAAPKP